MELIYILVPSLFFLLCLLEAYLSPSKVSLGLPKRWVRVGSVEAQDALGGLEYISEAPHELNSLRSRTRYVYVKGS
jgi:hypothetical protein